MLIRLIFALMLTYPFSAISEGCKYEYGGASVTYMTPEGSPVVYRMYQCGKNFKREYFDLKGKLWSKIHLVPSVRHQLNEVLEIITGKNIDINEDLDAVIERVAKERGIL